MQTGGGPDSGDWEVSLYIHSFTNLSTLPFLYAGTVALVPGVCCCARCQCGEEATQLMC